MIEPLLPERLEPATRGVEVAWIWTALYIHRVRFRTREEARAAVFDYIEIFYNCSSQSTSLYVVDWNRFC